MYLLFSNRMNCRMFYYILLILFVLWVQDSKGQTHWSTSGAPNDCFLQISVRRSKCCLEISIAQEKLKIST